MGIPVIVYGRSGSGKSRSLMRFGEEEIFLVNVARKPLPFRKKFKYVLATDVASKITDKLKKMPVKTAVIDDAGYLMTTAFMRGHALPKGGSSSFDLYNDIADSFWSLMRCVVQDLPEDVVVYVIMHEETSDYGETKLKTIGKLLNEKVCIEGMATICIRCLTDGDGRHFFRTQNSGSDVSKSPEEMLPLEMENDLKAVDDAIRAYYGLDTTNREENEQNA